MMFEAEKEEIKRWLKDEVKMNEDQIIKIVDDEGYCQWDNIYVMSYTTLKELGFKALQIDTFISKVLEKRSGSQGKLLVIFYLPVPSFIYVCSFIIMFLH